MLNELTARLQTNGLRYWRDKQGHEVDFVWTPRGRAPIAIECKWSARDFDSSNFAVFARAYPKAELRVVANDAHPAFVREQVGMKIRFVPLEALANEIAPAAKATALSRNNSVGINHERRETHEKMKLE